MDIQLFVKSKSDGAVRTFKFPAGAPVVVGRNPEAVVPIVTLTDAVEVNATPLNVALAVTVPARMPVSDAV